MNLLRKLFWAPFAQRKVDISVIDDFRGILQSKLERNSLPKYVSRHEPLVARLVLEAYSRAAIGEVDGVPRYGAMWSEIDRVAGQMTQVYRGETHADNAIGDIFKQFDPANNSSSEGSEPHKPTKAR